MDKLNKISLVFVIIGIFLVLPLVNASVGIGVSPSKINLQIESGKPQEIELLVFNTGDKTLDISLNVEGDLKDITKVEPANLTVEPEPVPVELPIKNGKTFKITFNPGTTFTDKTYTGKIIASGNTGAHTQLSGNVGVATQVTLVVTPSKSIFAFLTKTNLIIIGILIVVVALLIIIIYALKKAGLKIGFEKKKK